MFKASVIIPVYNAALYIKKAVQSALSQPETAEVLIVNDGSTDQTDAIIKDLSAQDERITILYHPEKENRGRAASRNLAIKNATQDYVAFIDADDFFLEDRFVNDRLLFDQHSNCDGVYNAIGAQFYRDATDQEKEKLKLTTITGELAPAVLFETLLFYKKGHFSIDGLTVKRAVFDAVGLFDESLKVGEDTNLFLRMALKSNLYTGIIDEPVAMRGVHEANVFDQEVLYEVYRLKGYKSLALWSFKNRIEKEKIDQILHILWDFKYREQNPIVNDIGYWYTLFIKSPRWLFSTLGLKYFPLVRRRKLLFKKITG